jgi:hypothetical protein
MKRKRADSWNMDDMLKAFLALLVHATPDGKVRISKATLKSIPNNFGSIMQVTDLGDAYLIRVLGIEELESQLILPPHGLNIPTGRQGPRDLRPAIIVPS